MRALLENFCVYHVTAPGQEDNSPTFPEKYARPFIIKRSARVNDFLSLTLSLCSFVYPTMDELASQLLFVLSHFGMKTVIGFGVGCGANILVRFALQYPDKVGALCLVNCSSTQAGWIEWGYQSMNARNLRSKGMTQGVLDYLMWHHFGRSPEERNLDLVQMYKSYFERSINPVNLALFIDSYVKRTDMNIARTPTGSPQANGEMIFS
jgi:pimeloyl-ACP methyl ester carboxylesterase